MQIMIKIRFTLLLTIISTVLPFFTFAQTHSKKVIDMETGLAVPYVTIYNTDKSIVRQSNEDGLFSIEINRDEVYTISQIGYKPVTLTAEQLLSEKSIMMEALRYEMNPVIVSADAALKDIYTAIDSTYKRIKVAFPMPFYLRCFKRDEIFLDNTKVLDAKAIIDMKAIRLRPAGKGAFGYLALKGIETICSMDDIQDALPIQNSPIPAINNFLVGFKKQYDEGLTFTRIHSEDNATMIISYQPKSSNYESIKKSIFASGRFIIDLKTWNIIRIDLTLDNKAIEYQNKIAATITSAKKMIHEQNCSMYFNSNGMLSKIEQLVRYSLKNKPDESFTWTALQVYKDISKTDYQQKPYSSFNLSKFILYQKQVTFPEFNTQFNLGFK